MLETVAGSRISSVTFVMRPKRGPGADFSLRDNKMYVAVGWSSAQQDTWPGVPEQQGASQSSFVLDTRSSLNVYLGSVQRAPSTLDAAPILRQSYKILNYCPLNHAAPPQCHQMQRRTLTGQREVRASN